MEPVEWRPVVGAEEWYAVSSDGRVRRTSTGRGTRVGLERVLHPDTAGYLLVQLCMGAGVKKTVTVHTLVAAAFLGPRPPDLQVDHKDGNKLNNRSDNLRYVTRGENIRAAHAMGLVPLASTVYRNGGAHRGAKLTEADVREIRRRRALGHTLKAIAVDFGIDWSNVSKIARGETWDHLVEDGA